MGIDAGTSARRVTRLDRQLLAEYAECRDRNWRWHPQGQRSSPSRDYNRKNKLPYTMNQTLDIQWQPRNDLAIDIGYVGNLGRHEVIPVPFNQAQIATPTNPIRKGTPVSAELHLWLHRSGSSRLHHNLRSDYSARRSADAQQLTKAAMWIFVFPISVIPPSPIVHRSRRLCLQRIAGPRGKTHEPRIASWVSPTLTLTHLDEQSAMGLFYNGNNPLNLRSGYGNSDFDRTHVINFTFFTNSRSSPRNPRGRARLAMAGALRASQFSRAASPTASSTIRAPSAASSTASTTASPTRSCRWRPAARRRTRSQASSGAFGTDPALKPQCFTLPLLSSWRSERRHSVGRYLRNQLHDGQRNIFRQSWQRRADISIVKNTKINERFR